MTPEQLMQRAIDLSREGLRSGAGGPFGAVVARNGEIVGEGCNRVLATQDPTAHGEIVAIRNACEKLKTYWLDGCEIYTSCEPCPMCLGAIYWARLAKIYYANSAKDADRIGAEDLKYYREFAKPKAARSIPSQQIKLSGAWDVFQEWAADPNRRAY